MAQLTATNVSKNYGIRPILEDVQFIVNEKDKVGIIGQNGSGKTTLMRIIAGDLEADSGAVHRSGDLRVGYLKQNVHIESDKSVYEECKNAYWRAFEIEAELASLEEDMAKFTDDEEALARVLARYQLLTDRFEEEGGLSYQSEIKGMLKGMGFEESQFDAQVNYLSGGEKSRLELAIMLLGRPDILLLDEPTNHLDMHAVEFLEGFLKDFRGAVLLISHDRYFLDKVVNHIFLIEHHKLHAYACGYKEYTLRRKKDLEILRHAYSSQQKEVERQKEIIDRLSRLGGSKRKRGISQSRSRQKLLDKMQLIDAPAGEEQHMNFQLKPKYESGEDVLTVEGLAKSFDDTKLFEGVSFDLHRGQRIGLIGDNGTGKTTLFRILLGEVEEDSGRVSFGTAVKAAWFDQEQTSLTDDNTVLDELWDRYPRLNHYEVRSYLAKFQFTGDDIFQLVGDLSGGEKARLALLKLMLSSANLLLLDEPTNHLDIESREILEEALIDYAGTIFVISHDRYFLNTVCNRILHLSHDGIEAYLGNYDDYLRQLELGQISQEEAIYENKTQQKKEEKKKRLAQRELRQLKVQVRDLQKEIDELTAKKKALLEASYQPEVYADHIKARDHQIKIEDMEKVIEEKSNLWLELQLQLEEEE